MAFAALWYRAQESDRAFPQRRSKERSAPRHGQPLFACASRFDRELLEPAPLMLHGVGAARVHSSDAAGGQRPEAHFERLSTFGDADRRDAASRVAHHQLIGTVRGVIEAPPPPAGPPRS